MTVSRRYGEWWSDTWRVVWGNSNGFIRYTTHSLDEQTLVLVIRSHSGTNKFKTVG